MKKKRLMKVRLYRFYMHVIQSAIFWMIVGFVISGLTMNSLLVTAFTQIDKVLVCK